MENLAGDEYGTQLRYFVARGVGSPLRGFTSVDRADRCVARARPEDGWNWLRSKNDEPDREERRGLSGQTKSACASRGYIVTGSHTVALRHVSACIDGTKVVSPSLGEWPFHAGTSGSTALAPQPTWTKNTSLSVAHNAVFAEALEQAKSHKVVAVNAASAYHSGGGFTTGGRHALEEAMCTQSSLFASLEHAETLAGAEGFPLPSWATPAKRRDGGPWHVHVPNDGVVFSPFVEIFRGGSDIGYAFQDEAIKLEAVVSVAMPNCNDRMSDSPVDCHPELEGYVEQLRKKWRAVLAAAAYSTEADCLVVPDAGCGVFRNTPAHVGDAFGRILREEFQGRFAKVVIAFPGGPGGEEFARFAMDAFEGRAMNLPPPPTVSASVVPLAPVPQTGAARSVVWEFSVSRGFEPFDPSASMLAEEAYQRYKTTGQGATAQVPSRGKIIVVDFVNMTQHLEGSAGRKRTLQRREVF